MRQVFAFSGVIEGDGEEGRTLDLTLHALSLAAPARRLRLCYIPTALGDPDQAVTQMSARIERRRPDVTVSSLLLFPQPNVPDIRAHLLANDVLLVEGGSVVNLMAVWRAHGLPDILRECWDQGVVLAGVSAGSICWHVGGPTDSFRDELDPFTDGLALLPFSNGVHDDFSGQPRRRRFREMVASGQLTAGYATEDGVGLHYVDQALHEALTVRPGSRAWHVTPGADGAAAETAIEARLLDRRTGITTS